MTTHAHRFLIIIGSARSRMFFGWSFLSSSTALFSFEICRNHSLPGMKATNSWCVKSKDQLIFETSESEIQSNPMLLTRSRWNSKITGLRSTGWFLRSTLMMTRPWGWSRRPRKKSRNFPRECITVCFWLIFMHWNLSIALLFHKTLWQTAQDQTGPKSLLWKQVHRESLLARWEPNPKKSTAFYFVLESNDSSRFQMKKRAVEELKKDHLKNVRLRAVPMMIKKRWVAYLLNWLQCVSSTVFSKTSFQDVCRCISWFGFVFNSLEEIQHFRMRNWFVNNWGKNFR